MEMKLLALCVLFLAGFKLSSSKKYVKSEGCTYGDTGCIQNMISHVLHTKFKGDRSIGLVKLDPVRVKIFEIIDEDINLVFHNISMQGLKDFEVTGVTGFGDDPTERHTLQFKSDYLNLTGKYNMAGNFKFLKLFGEGVGNISLANVELKLAFNGETYLKNEEEFITPEKFTLQIIQSGGSANFDNLFEEDEKKTKSFNEFLNYNFDNIFEGLNDSISEAFATVARKIIKRVFEKIRYSDLFEEE